MAAFESVCAGYDGRLVLRDLSFALPENGCAALTGPSGIGKTTALRLLAGLEKPLSGRITGLSGKRALMLFQEDRLLPWRTALQNVALPADSGFDCEKTLRALGIEDVAQYPEQMSGGMRRRVALARALCQKMDILLLDEPFSGIDAPLRERIAPLVLTAAPLIVLATHDAGDIVLMRARTIALKGAEAEEFLEKD